MAFGFSWRSTHSVPLSFKLLVPLLAASAMIGCSQGYTLRLDPKVGSTTTYDLKMSGAQSLDITMTFTCTSNNSSQVVTEARISSMSIGGQQASGAVGDMLKKILITITQDHQGHTLSSKITGAPANSANQANMVGAAYPDHSVKVGDTWTTTATVMGKDVQSSYKLVKIESVGGKQVADLEVTPSSPPAPNIKLDGPMRVSVDLSTGMPVEVQSDMEIMGQKESLDMKGT